MVNSTLDDLVLFLYDDLNAGKQLQLKKEMDAKWPLKEKYKVLKESYDRLSKIKLLSPRQQTIDAIMKYALNKSAVNSR